MGWVEEGSREVTLEGLSEHWNAGSAVKRSNDKKQKGGWLLWNKRRGGVRQGSSGVDLQEPCYVTMKQPGKSKLTTFLERALTRHSQPQ